MFRFVLLIFLFCFCLSVPMDLSVKLKAVMIGALFLIVSKKNLIHFQLISCNYIYLFQIKFAFFCF